MEAAPARLAVGSPRSEIRGPNGGGVNSALGRGLGERRSWGGNNGSWYGSLGFLEPLFGDPVIESLRFSGVLRLAMTY
jgi:hypothetical protein